MTSTKMTLKLNYSYPTSTRRHGNFAGVHTLLRIILSSNSAVLNNIITGVSPPRFDFFVFYVFKFLKRDWGTIPVAEIINGKIEIFSKHQRFLIATESSKYLLIFVLYVCVILCEFGTAISKRYACFCCLFKIIMSGLLC
jgi:hypothetical protein